VWLLAVLTLADSARSFKVPLAPGESLAVAMAGAGQSVVLIPGLFGSELAFASWCRCSAPPATAPS